MSWEQLQKDISEEFSDIRFDKTKGGFSYGGGSGSESPVHNDATCVQRIFELYSSGNSERKTAEKCGVTREVVRSVLTKLGVAFRERVPKRKQCKCGRPHMAKGMCASCWSRDHRKHKK